MEGFCDVFILVKSLSDGNAAAKNLEPPGGGVGGDIEHAEPRRDDRRFARQGE